jgi:hypothetical protein
LLSPFERQRRLLKVLGPRRDTIVQCINLHRGQARRLSICGMRLVPLKRRSIEQAC